MYVELLAAAVEAKHGTLGCLAQMLESRSQIFSAMHHHAKVLQLINLFGGITSIHQGWGDTLAMLKDPKR